MGDSPPKRSTARAESGCLTPSLTVNKSRARISGYAGSSLSTRTPNLVLGGLFLQKLVTWHTKTQCRVATPKQMCNRMRVVSATAIPLYILQSHTFFYSKPSSQNPGRIEPSELQSRFHAAPRAAGTENFSSGVTAGDSAGDVEDLGFGNFRDENPLLNI